MVSPPSAKNADFLSANKAPNFELNAVLMASTDDLIWCTF